MRLSQLTENMAVERVAGPADVTLTGVRDDSRRVQPGDLFIARRGTETDGTRFIDDALRRGAVAVLADRPVEVDPSVAMLVGDATGLVGELAERFHGRPARRLTLIGVTGTNGKTTTAWMIRHLINATTGKCGLISTVEVDVGGDKPEAAALTTPGACELSEVLAAMVANGCDHAVMEVSSHALDQGRVAALEFDAAAFTNLSGDHLDYHLTMEAYASAKAKLFGLLGEGGVGLVNVDDPHHRTMIEQCTGRPVAFSGRGNASATYAAEAGRATAAFTDIRLRLPTGEHAVRCPLVGRHNVENLIAAVATVAELGIAVDAIVEAVAAMPAAPGRLERVTHPDAPFSVIVDYAHTDDALRNVLEALRPLMPEGSALRVVFGCGGERDATKRPRMARVACALADRIVITSDNPRSEDPRAIIEQVMTGVGDADRQRVVAVVDRDEAIAAAIDGAQPGDVVLIAGKGHEDYQIIGAERRMFDDRIEARACLRRRFGDGAVLEHQSA